MIDSPVVRKIVSDTNQRAIIRVLSARFGPVPAFVQERVGQIQDETRLDALVEEAARCGSIESFRASLD